MATRQVIQIEVTWSQWRKLRLNHLITYLASLDDMTISRLTVKELKK